MASKLYLLLVATYLHTWAASENWESVQLTPEYIWTALEMLESLVAPAQRESAWQVAWMFLMVVCHATHETVWLQQRVQSFQWKEEDLEQWLVATDVCYGDG